MGKSHHIQAVVDGDDYNVTAHGKVCTVIARGGARQSSETASMAPKHNWAFAAVIYAAGPYIQYQAVFALEPILLRTCRGIALGGSGSVFEGLPIFPPWDRIFRWHEPVFASCTGTVRNPFEDIHFTGFDTANLAELGIGIDGGLLRK